MFIILTLAMLSPSMHQTASATCATGDNSELCASSQASTELSLNLQTSISVALENQVDLTITPTSTGATGYSSSKLSVSTNSNEGYGLFLSTSSPDGNLLSTSSNNNATINNTTLSNVTLNNLEKNSYGYALESTSANDSTKYSHLPTTSTAVKTTNNVTPSDSDYAYGDTYYLSFGAKIGTDIPAGSYSGAVTVSAIANPRTIAYLSDLTYMQEMSSDICTNTREGYTKQLVDTRDGKSYWVAKLKDGNCWMTQNLALDLGTGSDPNLKYVAKLTPADSDVSEEWVPVYSTNSLPLDADYVNSARKNYASWNLGEIVLATPLRTDLYANSNSCEGTDDSLNYSNGKFLTNLASLCSKQGIVDVSGVEWTPTFASQPGNYDGKSYSLVSIDSNIHAYDSHYLLGNYYQSLAATAGSINESEKAPASICPKGWKLPDGYGGDNLYSLLHSYGYPSSESYNNGRTVILNNGKLAEDNPFAPPMYFTMSGDVYPIDHGVYTVGGLTFLWSSSIEATKSNRGPDNYYTLVTPSMSAGGNFILLHDTDVYMPGNSIRCVAK